MTTPRTPDNTILTLYPPRAPEATTPVEGAHYGVPKHVYDLKPMGLTIDVDPPLAGTVQPGDVIRLVLNKAPTEATKTIQAGEENDVQTLYLPKGLLLPNQLNTLVYTITRASQNIGTSTPELTLLYNAIRPGLTDRGTDPGGHSELELILPESIKNGVGPEFLSADICVAYPYCRAYDRITLRCNGELLEPEPKVKPNQAPEPPNPGSQVPITICFTIDRAFLLKAKRLDKKLHFFYTVTDQLGNGPDTDAPWSPVQTVDEDLDGELLPMPILREVPSDSNDEPGIIDLEKLAGKALSVVVLTSDDRFVVGHDVIATYTAKNTGQPADVVVVVRGKVEQDDFGQKIPCVLEVPNDKIFASSAVTVIYELRKPGGDLVGTSSVANATVTGAAPIKLLPPALVGVEEPIDVLAYPNGVTVRISFPEALPGDRARLVEVNAPAGSPQFPLEDFVDKQVNIVLSAAFLAARHGKVMELRWNLNRNGGQAGKSDSVNVSVQKIADEDPRFPTPNIAGNTGSELDVQKLAADARILAEKWPLFELGQSIRVRCSGIDENGNPVHIDVRSGEANDSANGLSVEAPTEWLNKLDDATELSITVRIKFDKEANETAPTLFPIRKYKVENQYAPGYENWEAIDIGQYYQFNINDPKTMPSGLTITSLNNTELPPGLRRVSAGNPGTGINTMASGGYGASVRFDLPRPSNRTSFIYKANHSLNRATFYDSNNNTITHQNIQNLEGTINFNSNVRCAYFVIDCHDIDGGFTIDDISWGPSR